MLRLLVQGAHFENHRSRPGGELSAWQDAGVQSLHEQSRGNHSSPSPSGFGMYESSQGQKNLVPGKCSLILLLTSPDLCIQGPGLSSWPVGREKGHWVGSQKWVEP